MGRVRVTGAARCCVVRCGVVRCCGLRRGAVRYGTVRCFAVRCCMLRCGAVLCGAVLCSAISCGRAWLLSVYKRALQLSCSVSFSWRSRGVRGGSHQGRFHRRVWCCIYLCRVLCFPRCAGSTLLRCSCCCVGLLASILLSLSIAFHNIPAVPVRFRSSTLFHLC